MYCDRCWSHGLICITSAYQRHNDTSASASERQPDDLDGQVQGQGRVSVLIEGVQVVLNRTIFTYTQDPQITHVQPTTSFIASVSTSISPSSLITLSLCLLETLQVNYCAKTAEPIKMPFGAVYHELDRGR